MGVFLVELSAIDAIPEARTVGEQMAFDVVFGTPPPNVVGDQLGLDAIYVDAYGGGGGGAYNAEVVNKAWHVPTVQWVYWRTATPDSSGASYPGPGTFGECTNYAVESIVYVPA